MLTLIVVLTLTKLLLVLGAPAVSQGLSRHADIKTRQEPQDSLPLVKLPYVSHRAYSYDPLRDVSTSAKAIIKYLQNIE
jgi:hypothetical protein